MLCWSRPAAISRHHWATGYLLFVLSLTGCATSPTAPSKSSIQPPPDELQQWSVVGKAAITHAGDTDTVNLTWERLSQTRDRVTVSGPLGAGLRIIERQANALYEYRGDALEPLQLAQLPAAQAALLTSLPVEALGDAVLRGRAPNDDWQATVNDWTDSERWRVPRKLTFQSHNLTLRIVLLRWTLPEVAR